jgi:hypothetical protein
MDNPSSDLQVGDATNSHGFWLNNGRDVASGPMWLYGISPLLPGAAISDTTTTVATTSNPVFGQPVTLTATITPSLSDVTTATGTVKFYDGATLLGTTTLTTSSNNTVQFQATGLAPGSHLITAVYHGDPDFFGSTSTATPLTVNQAATTTQLNASSTSATYGQSLTFTASVVSSGSGAPSGSVTFYDGTTALGTIAVSSGAAQYSTSTLPSGNHQITATYNGDANFATSSSSPAIAVTIAPLTTTTSLAVTPTAVGGPATFMANVFAGGVRVTGGLVTFFDGTTNLGTAPIRHIGDTNTYGATLAVTTLAAGNHPITAVYAGSTAYAASTSSATNETITAGGHHVLFVTASSYYIVPDTSVPPNLPAFGGIGAADWIVTNEAFQAGLLPNWNPNTDAALYHAIVSISGNNAADRIPISGPIYNVKGDLIATSKADLWDGSLAHAIAYDSMGGAAMQQLAVLTGSSPTGQWSGTSAGALDNPSTNFTAGDATSAIGLWIDSVSAVASNAVWLYGISPLLPGAAISDTTTTVTTTTTPAFGQPVTLIATIAPTLSDVAPSTGTVQFYDGATSLGTTTLSPTSGNVASFTTAALTAGNHSFTAVYHGDVDFYGSASAPLNVSLAPPVPIELIIISGFMANPTGSDAPYEYVQLVATRAIDFSQNPYSVVFANNGAASSNGWVAGAALTYGFNLSSGSVQPGQVFYVGGSAELINGSGSNSIASATWVRTINTSTSGGDGFGAAGAGGQLGNGGTNADGLAVFAGLTGSLTATTVPVDALFFGTAVGQAAPATGGYTVPANDRYATAQGTFGHGTNTYLFSDAATQGQFIRLTGSYDATQAAWSTPRISSVVTSLASLSDIASTISITFPASGATVNGLIETSLTADASAELPTATIKRLIETDFTESNSPIVPFTVARSLTDDATTQLGEPQPDLQLLNAFVDSASRATTAASSERLAQRADDGTTPDRAGVTRDAIESAFAELATTL